tara:strand:- start:270 stop:458 length:189 start_codon:yes stop_codon:yes gene_type:complete
VGSLLEKIAAYLFNKVMWNLLKCSMSLRQVTNNEMLNTTPIRVGLFPIQTIGLSLSSDENDK